MRRQISQDPKYVSQYDIDENEQEIFKKDSTSEDFFKAISYVVEVQDLMKIKKTCYHHQGFDFCPILLELVDQRLKDHYQANYILQVWDKSKTIIYEKYLKYELASWNVFSNHLIFKLDSKEEDSGDIFIVHLRKKGAITKVKEFVNDNSYIHVGIVKDLFYYASQTTIKVIDIRQEIKDEEVVHVDVTQDESKVVTYPLTSGCKLHGFYENQYCTVGEERNHYLICLVEGKDNQIDFTRIYFWSRDIKKKDINFYQYTEVVPRNVSNDPIVKLKYICQDTQFLFGVALRQSGLVDIYWNCKVVNSTKQRFEDVDINFDYIYLKKEGENVLQIDTKWDIRVGIDVAQEVQLSNRQWTNIFIQTIEQSVRLFSSYSLINTSFFLAHKNIISLFDIVNKKWVDHFYVETKVAKVFRNEKTVDTFNVGAYLENGKIELIDSEDTTTASLWKQEKNTYTTTGKVLYATEDQKDYRQTYFLTKLDNGKVNIYGFSRKTLYIFNTLVEEVKETTQVIPFFEPSARTRFILYNLDEGIIRVYEHYYALNKEKVDTFYFHNVGKYEVSNKELIKGNIHSAMTYDQKKVIYLFDYKNIYQYDVASGSITKTYENENVEEIQFIDNKMCYMMVKKSEKRKQGIYVFKLVEGKDLPLENSFLLMKCMNSEIDFSKDNQRLTYSLDFEKIQIIPVIHRNVINFMGMQQRSNYLVTLRDKDKFHVLDKQSRITTWSLITGKLENQKYIETDLEGYEVFEYESMDITNKREWYQSRCLLKKKEPENDWNDKKFYDAEMLQTTLLGDTPYISIEKKKFHKFKIVQLISDKEVKVHYTFIHPFYGVGKYQRITFSDDIEYMLERLVNQRVLLYKRQPNEEKWLMIKRINRFPMDMSENSYKNYIFAPNFQHYIDYDRQTFEFVIKETLSGNVYLRIPKGLIDSTNEEIKSISKRFMWENSFQIKILNNDGIEKLYSIQNSKLTELGYASVPSFYTLNFKEMKHYYHQKPILTLGDGVERLLRKVQKYKSHLFLSQNPNQGSIFEILFDVDYSVENCKHPYVAEHSFTYLDWRYIENLTQDDDVDLYSQDYKVLQQMCFCIFPSSTTVLHEIYNKSNYLKALYDISSQESSKFEIPFIKNFNGETPMHICLNQKILKNLDFFFQELMNAPIDHHGRLIMDIVSAAIENNLPSIYKYLEKRSVQTEQIRQITRGSLKLTSEHNYSSCLASLWEDQQVLEGNLFTKKSIELDVKVECLDLPFLHCYNHEDGDTFIDSLAQTDVINYFNNVSVQRIIEYKWPIVKEYTIKKLMLPFFVFHVIFFLYANIVYEASIDDINKGEFPDEDQRYYSYACFVLLLLFCAYFLYQELRQCIRWGLEYLTSIWNYIDLIPIIFILIIIAFDFQEKIGEYLWIRSLISVTSVLLWFKVLYFLRIFKRTGYLIRIVVQVIQDMYIFFVVLFISIVAFTDAYYTLSLGGEQYAKFTGENFWYSLLWTYNMSIGNIILDGVEDSFEPITVWVLFFFTSFLNIIVLLNLLIAIISESFNQIIANSEQASNQELAKLIYENAYLIPVNKRKKASKVDKYLFIAKEFNEQDTRNKDEQLVDMFTQKMNKLESAFKAIDSRLLKMDKLHSNFDQWDKQLTKIDQLESSIKQIENNASQVDGVGTYLLQIEKKLGLGIDTGDIAITIDQSKNTTIDDKKKSTIDDKKKITTINDFPEAKGYDTAEKYFKNKNKFKGPCEHDLKCQDFTNGRSCDMCGLSIKEKKSYHCADRKSADCDFDICINCMDKINFGSTIDDFPEAKGYDTAELYFKNKQKFKGPCGHDLQVKDFTNNRSCDMCGDKITEKESYHCQERGTKNCDFDVCKKCMNKIIF